MSQPPQGQVVYRNPNQVRRWTIGRLSLFGAGVCTTSASVLSTTISRSTTATSRLSGAVSSVSAKLINRSRFLVSLVFISLLRPLPCRRSIRHNRQSQLLASVCRCSSPTLRYDEPILERKKNKVKPSKQFNNNTLTFSFGDTSKYHVFSIQMGRFLQTNTRETRWLC